MSGIPDLSWLYGEPGESPAPEVLPLVCICEWDARVEGHRVDCPIFKAGLGHGPPSPCPICDRMVPDHHGWNCPWWDRPENQHRTPF